VAVVLLVEDDPDVRELLEFILRSEGYDTITAVNGTRALEELHRRRPDVIVLDLMMPEMDGWTFRRRQLEDASVADVPVICITAVHDPNQAAAEMNAPCLQKPVDIEELLARLQDACNRRP
jgi:DNA-binding response OmpR family regulator